MYSKELKKHIDAVLYCFKINQTAENTLQKQ